MDYFIRPFIQQDILFLWEMLYQSIYVFEEEQPLHRDILKDPHIEKYLKDWGREEDHALIAVDEVYNPVGAIWIRRFDREVEQETGISLIRH